MISKWPHSLVLTAAVIASSLARVGSADDAIDTLLAEAHAQAGVVTSDLCDDATFVRRDMPPPKSVELIFAGKDVWIPSHILASVRRASPPQQRWGRSLTSPQGL